MNIIQSALCNIPLIALAILGLGFLVLFHELGHFLFAKLFNVYTPSFSIGFGPRLITKKIGDTVFAISAIPLGGYVELAGSPEVGQGEQAHAHATDERSFNRKPYWQKLLIIAGCIIFNLIFAYAAFSTLLYLGAPFCTGSQCDTLAPRIASVTPGSKAEKGQLKPDDTIKAINNQPVHTISEFTKQLENFIDKPVTLTVERDGKEEKLETEVGSQTIEGKKVPLLGVSWFTPPLALKDALIEGGKATWAWTAKTFGALKSIFKNREALGGPLLIITQMTKCAGMGFKMFLFMLAFISVNLAVFNVLPLPIFDGGQVLFFTIEAILGRPLSEEARYTIHYYTWLAVIALVIYLTYKDILKLAGW